jgi:hypothetical protein
MCYYFHQAKTQLQLNKYVCICNKYIAHFYLLYFIIWSRVQRISSVFLEECRLLEYNAVCLL